MTYDMTRALILEGQGEDQTEVLNSLPIVLRTKIDISINFHVI